MLLMIFFNRCYTRWLYVNDRLNQNKVLRWHKHFNIPFFMDVSDDVYLSYQIQQNIFDLILPCLNETYTSESPSTGS